MAEVASNAGGASVSFLEKQQDFEMEKETNQAATEAEAVDNLVDSEVSDAQQQAEKQAQSQSQAPTQPATTSQPPSTASEQTVAIEKKSSEEQSSPSPSKKEDKPMQWEDAVLVEDLTKERASADSFTKYIGANMKSKKVGASKAASFLQMGPPVYYYPVHPAFLQQAQRMHARQQQQASQQNKDGRTEVGASATTKGWGDYGTPLYYGSQFGSYDGMSDGLDGLNMYGNFGYAPYTSGYNPAYTQAAGGPASSYYSPYYSGYGNGGGAGFGGGGGGGGGGNPGFEYGGFGAPMPPPMPTDLPLPPFVGP